MSVSDYRRRPRSARAQFAKALGVSSYHMLSTQEKQAKAMERVREPAVMCPGCGMQVMADDLLAHMEQRCVRYEPGPAAKWIDHRHAVALGVPKQTLSWWANNGLVRFTGGRQDRKYLLRDLAMRVAIRRGFRRR